MRINWLRLIVSIFICQFIGNLGTIFTIPAITGWYLTLNKPSFTPPSWLFAPVWLTLYMLMGISLYFIWEAKARKDLRRRALWLFGFQLFLNLLWSLLFFGLHSPALGLVCIGALWLTILALMLNLPKVSRKALLLLIPYIIWITIALALNLGILWLN